MATNNIKGKNKREILIIEHGKGCAINNKCLEFRRVVRSLCAYRYREYILHVVSNIKAVQYSYRFLLEVFLLIIFIISQMKMRARDNKHNKRKLLKDCLH